MGGGFLHPHLPGSGNDRAGRGLQSPASREAGLAWLYPVAPAGPAQFPGVLAPSTSGPSLVGGGCVFCQARGGEARLYRTVPERLLEEPSFCPTGGTVDCLAPGWPEGPEPDSCGQQDWVGPQSRLARW